MKKNISTTVMNTANSVDGTAVQLQSATPRYQAVVGLDVGDRQSHYCVLDHDGGVVAEGEVKTAEASLRVLFEGKGGCALPWKRARIRPGSVAY